MNFRKLEIIKNNGENFFCFLVFIFSLLFFPLFSSNSFAVDSLSYSGRLVKADGSPVAGPVNLTIDLAYTNAPGTILCSQNFTGVVLSNGVFHLKLDLVCPGPPVKTLTEILTAVPATFAAALRVSDITNSKIYAFQEIHSMPFATVSESAKQLAQLGALNGEVLKWNDTTKKWEPGAAGGGGTVTNVTVSAPLAVTSGATTPAVSISQATTSTDGYLSALDWNTFNNKVGVASGGTTLQFYRGDNSWQTLNTSVVPESGVTNLYFSNARVLGVPLDGFVAGPGAIVATDTVLQAFAKAQGQINLINTNSSAYVTKTGTSTLAAGTIDAQAGFVLVGAPGSINDATPRGYVDTQDNLKVNKAGDTITGVLTLNNDLLIKGGSNYVTLKGHATTATYDFILPATAGTSGFVLKTDGLGNLSWIDPGSVASGSSTVNSASITDDSIMNADINSAAAIDQSKISGLVSALSGKQTTALATGNILVGSAGGVATAVSVSGDAALNNLGALTLTNTGVAANTYKSVTVDAKGRITGGTNPTTLAGFGITDTLVTNVTVTAPITVTGTTAPLIAMPAATNGVDGYLTAADRTAFNAKQDAITASTIINSREIRFNELTGNGVEYVSLKAPDALTANTTYTLPATDGTTGQVLTTNAAGILSWSTVATSGTNLAGDIGGTIGANTIGAGKVTSTHLLDGTIINADINAAAAIDYSKLNVPALAVPLTALNATGIKDGSKYLKGDDTWSVLQTDVQALLLSSYTIGTNAVVATGDSIVSAFGKLQKQISDLTTRAVGGDLTGNLPNPTIAKIQGSPISITTAATKQVLKYNGTTWVNAQVAAADLSATGTVDATTYLAGDNSWKNFNSGVIAAPITGVNTTGITKATSGLVGTDSLLTAFNKLLFTQGDYVSKTANQTINGTLAINSLTGFITVPTPLVANDAANKGYVDSYGQWLEGTGGNINDIYFSTGNVGVGTTTPASKLDVVANDSPIAISQTGFSYSGSTPIGAQLGAWSGAYTNTAGLKLHRWTGSGSIFDVAFVGQAWNGTGYGLDFRTNNVASFTDATSSRMYISNAGNVGIGTSTPSALFHVSKTGTSDPIALFSSPNAADSVAVSFGNGTGLSALAVSGGVGAFTPGTAAGDLIVRYPASKKVLFSNGGVRTDMVVGETGNVGIGTTTPRQRLDVFGTMEAASGITPKGSFVVGGAGTAGVLNMGVHNPGTFYSWIQSRNEASATYYNLSLNPEGGNVGIGTTSPARNLVVVDQGGGVSRGLSSRTYAANPGGVIEIAGSLGTLAAPSALTINKALGYLAFNGFDGTDVTLQSQPTGVQSFTTENWTNTTKGSNLYFTTTPNGTFNGVERMRIDQNGNIGIGTNAPNYLLDVRGTGTSLGSFSSSGDTLGYLDIQNSSTGNNAGSIARLITKNVANTTSISVDIVKYRTGGFVINNNETDVAAYTGFNQSGAERMRITSAGKVGIGTVTPLATLHVAGTGYIHDGLSYIEQLSRPDATLNVTNNHATKRGFTIHHENSTALIAQWYHCPGGACTQKMGFDTAGNMVIGGLLTQSSDERLKKNIEPLESSLEKVLNLQGVSYYWKDKNTPGKQVGLIAQEVEKQFPEAVRTDKDGWKSVAYQNLVAPMINAIKELYALVASENGKQNREIASLKENNQSLNAKMDSLEKQNLELKVALCEINPKAKVCGHKQK